MKKQFLRVKQIADQTFLRAEKTEVLTEDLVNAEKRVEIIKQSFQAAHKKISSCQIDFGSEGSTEKRMRKLPQVALAASMLENGYSFCKTSVLGATLKECASTQAKLGNELLEYYNEVEKSVLKPMSNVLENEIHNISKLRKQLGKLTLDMDSARSRFLAAEKQQASSTSSTSAAAAKVEKMDTLKDELEEASQKVEQTRDALACEMYSLISKEPHLSEIFVHFHKLQANYHRNALAALEASLPILEKELDDFPQKPVYGCPLQEHLRVTEREIAHVIEVCVCFLLEWGISEEGILRIAGSASKLKKLKSAFDAGLDIDMTEYVRDPHAVCGALKSYLRELPEPLLTFCLYEEWVNAARVFEFDQRLQALWQVLYKLPSANFVNLRCVVKFLSKVSENSDVNKMSSQNIAIIMAPNLIWTQNEDANFGVNMQTANIHSSIIGILVSYADWFFPDAEPTAAFRAGLSLQSHHETETEDDFEDHGSQTSPQSMLKSNKKPFAPPPPPKKYFLEEKFVENICDSSFGPDISMSDSGFPPASLAIVESSVMKANNTSDSYVLPSKEDASPKSVVRRRSNENIPSLTIANANKCEKPNIPEKPSSYSSYSLDRKVQKTSFVSKNWGPEKLLEHVSKTQRPTVPPPERPAKPSRIYAVENSVNIDAQKPTQKSDSSSDHCIGEVRNENDSTLENTVDLVDSEAGVMLHKQQSCHDQSDPISSKPSVKQNRFEFLVTQTAEKPPERPPRSFPLVHEICERICTSAEETSLSGCKDTDNLSSSKLESSAHSEIRSSVLPAIKSPDGDRTKPPRPQPPIPYAKPKGNFTENTNL